MSVKQNNYNYLNWVIQDSEKESDSEHSDLGKQIFGNVPTFETEPLRNPNLRVEMWRGRHHTLSDDQNVFQADESYQVGHNVHLEQTL